VRRVHGCLRQSFAVYPFEPVSRLRNPRR
jgi:hypothetical protein